MTKARRALNLKKILMVCHVYREMHIVYTFCSYVSHISRCMPNVSPYIIHRLFFIMDTVYFLCQVLTILFNVDIFVSSEVQFYSRLMQSGSILGKSFASVKRLRTAEFKQQAMLAYFVNIHLN